MSNVFIPAGIRDKATRDTLIAIVKQLSNGNVTIAATPPNSYDPGAIGDIIYASSNSSIWIFDGNQWTQGPVGPTGPAGADGADGADGLDGADGVDGLDGSQGIQGEAGADGNSSYFHVAYADTSSGGGFSQSPTNKEYIGTYVDFNASDSTTASDYTWVLIKGAQGATGNQGIAGTNGVNGNTSYLHIAYADTSSGGGFSQSPTNKEYIGTYVDFNATDSTTASDYTWALIKGADGTDGVDGTDGTDGTDAIRYAEVTLYTNPTVANAPSAPSATITWSTGAISSITSGWSQTPPTISASSSNSVYSSQLIFIDATAPFNTTTVTGTTPIKSINFTGLVTFSSATGSFVDNGTTITNIDGGNIATGSIIAGSSLKVGNIAINSDVIPVSGEGMAVVGANNAFTTGTTAGDFVVGKTNNYLSWDTSDGELTIKGSIIQADDGSVAGLSYVQDVPPTTAPVGSIFYRTSTDKYYIVLLINNVRTFREFGSGGSAATDLLLSGSTVSPTITGIPGTPNVTFTSGTGTVDISSLDDDDWVIVYSVGGGGGGALATRQENDGPGVSGSGTGGGGGATLSIASKYELGDTLTYSVGSGGSGAYVLSNPNQAAAVATGGAGGASTVTGAGNKDFLTAPGGGGGTGFSAGSGSGSGGIGGSSSFSWVDADFYYTNVVADAIVAGGITNISNITQSGGNGAGASGSSPANGTSSAWGGAGAGGATSGNAGGSGKGGTVQGNGTNGFIRIYYPR